MSNGWLAYILINKRGNESMVFIFANRVHITSRGWGRNKDQTDAVIINFIFFLYTYLSKFFLFINTRLVSKKFNYQRWVGYRVKWEWIRWYKKMKRIILLYWEIFWTNLLGPPEQQFEEISRRFNLVSVITHSESWNHSFEQKEEEEEENHISWLFLSFENHFKYI